MTTAEFFRGILAAIPSVTASVLIMAGILWVAVRAVGATWLNNWFATKLEDYKHVQQQELERLRLAIDTHKGAREALRQREFEVLPDAWSKLSVAYSVTRDLISSLQSNPDLDAMKEAQLAEFLVNTELPAWQKDELRVGSDKTARYASAIFWPNFNKANNSVVEFHNYVVTNGIFIKPELKEKMMSLSKLLQEAIRERRFLEQKMGNWENVEESARKVNKEGSQLLDAIEIEVTNRLWTADQLTPA